MCHTGVDATAVVHQVTPGIDRTTARSINMASVRRNPWKYPLELQQLQV